MDDLRSGLISTHTKAPAPRLLKTDGQRLQERLDRLTEEGRRVGGRETVCAPLAPETCRTPLERSAWVDGYMDGYAKAARNEMRQRAAGFSEVAL